MITKVRPKSEDYTARFPPGTLRRMEKALVGRETKADFIRLAVEEFLRGREADMAVRTRRASQA